MAARLKTASGGGCCECEQQQSACDCSAIPCGRECQAKAATAELCGFIEFDPQVPPNKYKKRKIRSEGGPFTTCSVPAEDCEITTCPGGYPGGGLSASAAPIFGGFVRYQMVVTPQGSTATHTTLQVTVIVAEYVFEDGSSSDPPSYAQFRVRIESAGIVLSGFRDGVATVDVPNGMTSVALDVNSIFWQQVFAECLDVGSPTYGVTSDDWDLEQLYSDLCTGPDETDLSSRVEADQFDCEPPGGGTPIEIPCDSPALCYGGGVTTDIVDPATRTFTGAGCVDDGDGTSTSYDGGIVEELSLIDSEADAMERALTGMEWGGGLCNTLTAFRTARGAGEYSFAFRNAQVRVTFGSVSQPLTLGHNYRVTVRYTRRVLGSVGPFVFLGIDELTIIADETIETTPWLDIPNDSGWETRAEGCVVEDITPP